MRRIEIEKGKLVLTEGVIGFFQKSVTKFGTGAKIDCPKIILDNLKIEYFETRSLSKYSDRNYA
jgi:putative transposon-encoded protein